MRSVAAALLLAALILVPGGCRKQPEGVMKVLVIGGPPKIRDPSLGPLSAGDQLLLASTAQGLVSFDAAGNIVGALAERWTVTDDGLSYIFRLGPASWADGRKVTAEQVARLLKRQISARSRNPLKDRLGAVEDIVAMTDRVIEIRLAAPRPELLSILAEPRMAVLRGATGTGPFSFALEPSGGLRLTRTLMSADEESASKEELLLAGASAPDAVARFAADEADLVLGGTFGDLPFAQQVKLPRGALRFDPASGLFGLLPMRTGGALARREVRLLLDQALDRDLIVAALKVPGLIGRATLLEPGLEGMAAPAAPAWAGQKLADRLPALQAQARRLFARSKPTVSVAVPDGPGGALVLRAIQRSWGALGLEVERAESGSAADFLLVDEVAPSAGAAWFVRRFRCSEVLLCNPDADRLMDAARASSVPAQRYALLGQAAAMIDGDVLFIPIAAPVRWSLVSARVRNFAGNRYARHPLVGLHSSGSAGG